MFLVEPFSRLREKVARSPPDDVARLEACVEVADLTWNEERALIGRLTPGPSPASGEGPV